MNKLDIIQLIVVFLVAKILTQFSFDQRDPRSLSVNLTAIASACLIALGLPLPGVTQEQQASAGAPFVLNVPRGNPLEGLFTPQPQFPNSTSLLNPEATPPPSGELNPLKGLFTPQPQYLTPQALKNPEGQPPDGEVNHLTGLFTPPNQWATPRTTLNPQDEPRHLIPERQFLWGQSDEQGALYRQHNLNTYGREEPIPPKEKSQPRLEQTNAKSSATNKIEGANRPKLFTESQRPQEQQSSPLEQANFLIASSQYDLALQLINRILLEHPDNAQAHYLKAVALVNLRRYKDAVLEYKTVLALQPKDQLSNLARQGLKKIGVAK